MSIGPRDAVAFYRRRVVESAEETLSLKSDYEISMWRPTGFALFPPGVPNWRLPIWRAIYAAKRQRNGIAVLLVHDRYGAVVHMAVIQGRYFKLRFMGPADIMVGSLFTRGDERNRGLATTALQYILQDLRRRRVDCDVWFLTSASNRASIRVAEKCGFRRVANGTRRLRVGTRLLGDFQITSTIEHRNTRGSGGAL